MTKKNYIMFARIIKYAVECKRSSDNQAVFDYSTISYLVHQFCVYFEQDNPLFDRTKFIKACGL